MPIIRIAGQRLGVEGLLTARQTAEVAEVSAAVDRGRLFQAYSKAHPRA